MFSKALRVFGLLTVGLVLASCPGLGKINFEIDQTGPMPSEEQDDLIPGASQYSIRFDEAIKLSGTADTLTASLKYPITDEPLGDITVPRSAVSIGEESTRLVITIPDDASLQENMEITFTIPAGYLTDEVDNPNEGIIHPVTVSLGAAGIGSFEFLASENTDYLTKDVVATITADKTITAIVPYETDLSALVATFTASKDATVKVGGVDQVSGDTPNDFSNAVIYTVTAADGASFNTYINNYTVKVIEDTPPGPPTGVTVKQLDHTGERVEVSWGAPNDKGTNNGIADIITGYTVYYWKATASEDVKKVKTTKQSEEINISQLLDADENIFAMIFVFAVVANNSSSSSNSSIQNFTATKIEEFTFTTENNAVIDALIVGNTITAVVPWGTSSNLSGQPRLLNTQSTNTTYLDENGDPITSQNYSNDVTLRLKSINGNFHDYTVSVLEIGYKEDEVTADAAKEVLTPGDLSHPWLFSIKNLDSNLDPKAKAVIELTLGNNTYNETLSAQELTVPTTASDGAEIYGVSLVNQRIITDNPYGWLQGLTDKTATITITITEDTITEEAGKKYPVWKKTLPTGVENVYSWHDLQSMDASYNNREYLLACHINFPKPGTYGFPTYGFTPIKTDNKPFIGQLTGNDVKNYVIKDFYINADNMPPSTTLTNIGMFDTIIMDGNAVNTYIENLTFMNPKIIAKNEQYQYSNVGVLAGEIMGTTTATKRQFIKGVYVDNVIINADATNIGGIVGKITAHTHALFYVSSSGTITAASASTNVGGLVGYSEGIVVVGYSTADVTGGDVVGGLVGYDKGNTVGFSFGTVSGTTSTTIGGLVGEFMNPAGYIFGYYAGESTKLFIAGRSEAFDDNVGLMDRFFEPIGNHMGLGDFNDPLWMFGNEENPNGFNFGQSAPQTFRDNQDALLSSK